MIFKEAKEKNVGVPFDSEKKEDSIVKEEVKKTKEPDKPVEKNAEATIAVNLRLSPSLDGDILCVLFTGVKVKVTDYNTKWYTLQYQGRKVYVLKDYIKLI